MTKNLVSIIMLTYNQIKYTKLCIESIFNHTSLIKTPFEIIVVDNASTDGTVEYLEGLEQSKEIRVIYNRENLGFPKGNNQAVEIAKGEYICLLNNDTIVTENWLENLLRVLRSDEKIAMVGPYCNASSGYQMIQNVPVYQDDKGLNELCKKFNAPIKEVDFLVFFCCLIKRSVWDEVGGLDERMGRGCYEDNIFCYKVLEKGYKLKVVNHYIHHWGSISFKGENKDPEKYKAYLELLGRNQKLFFKKIDKYKRISLCMIVGLNEKPETLKRCIDSVVDYVDSINIYFNYKHFFNRRKYERLKKVVEEYEEVSIKVGKYENFRSIRIPY